MSFNDILGVGRKRVREVSTVNDGFLRWAAAWIWMFYIKKDTQSCQCGVVTSNGAHGWNRGKWVGA